LNLLCNSEIGRQALARAAVLSRAHMTALEEIGNSGWANIIASIKLARYMNYGPDDVIMTIATDSARLYSTEAEAAREKFYPDGFDSASATQIYRTCLADLTDEHVLELSE